MVIIVKAQQMHDEAVRVRKDFVQNHLQSLIPYPIAQIFRPVSMRPTNEASLRLLVRRGNIDIQVDGTLSNSGTAVEAPFQAQLEGSSFPFWIAFPSDIVLSATPSSDTLTLKVNSRILITLQDDVVVHGIPLLGRRQLLKSVIASDEALEYEFENGDDPSDRTTIHMQLTSTLSEHIASLSERGHSPTVKSTFPDDGLFSCNCSCGQFTAPKDGWYVVETVTECDSEYLTKGQTICGDAKGGPYASQQLASDAAQELCGHGSA
jgi:hypothetical protein